MLHTIKRTTKNKKAKLVGRGGTRGKTSGRGTKGQKARAGHKIRPHIRDIIKKLPKLRGRGKNINKAFKIKPSVVNVSMLDKAFEANATVTPSALFAKSLIRRVNGRLPHVKILAAGDITKALIVHDCEVSTGAQEKITAAGGTIHA
jgi:large subunit ribosomal protein L15